LAGKPKKEAVEMSAPELTAERLRELLHYDPETGEFVWRVRRGGCAKNGAVAGKITHFGYRHIGIDGLRYYAHRLAWLYMTDAGPKADIDHINLDKGDNRWVNLRHATRSQNHMNRNAYSNNRSGFKRVDWHRGKWRATIRIKGKQVTLGLFDRPDHAANVYHASALWYHGEYARVDTTYRETMGLTCEIL
jgi:hypothetical protein